MRSPGGPGRLVLRQSFGNEPGAQAQETDRCAGARQQAVPPPAAVIRAGDGLIVEEHTAVVEARLEAVALGPAVRGAV